MYRFTFRKRNPTLFFFLLLASITALFHLKAYTFTIFTLSLWLIFEYMYRLPVFPSEQKLDKLDNQLGILKFNDTTIVSPVYGRVREIESKRDYTRIITTFGLLDVHYQFVPMKGMVDKVTVHDGERYLAMLIDRSGKNKRKVCVFTNKKGLNIYVVSYAGFMSGEIQTTLRNGEKVYAGKPYGFLPFDGRVDIILPNKNKKKGLTLLVKKGDHLAGPSTPLCVY